MSLQGDGLLRALTEIALEVQKARSLMDVLRVAGAGLEGIGFNMMAAELHDGAYSVRYVTAQEEALVRAALEAAGLDRHARRALDLGGPIRRVLDSEQPYFVEDVGKLALALFPAAEHPRLEAAVKAFGEEPWRAILAPLNVRGRTWGVLGLFHPQLRVQDMGVLNLFVLQLGSAIEVSETIEHLERRNAELSLVHQLTVAGSRADTPALTRQALEAVCRTTRSDAGILHRYDAERGVFAAVGGAFGYQGPLNARYQTFSVPAADAMLLGPRATRLSALGTQSSPLQEGGFTHVATVPLSIEGTLTGMLSLARRGDEPYAAQELQSAEILGVQMASFLERTRLYDDLKKSYDDLGRAQSELVRHERLAALGELAAVMAHEVRNPLGVIFNSLTTLKRLLKPAGDAEMLLNMVGEEAERLNRIVGDLLDFVRPYELAKKPIAVEPIIDGAVDAALKSLANQAVRVVTEVPAALPPFAVDGQLVRQALVNLIINAAQAMPRGGLVTLRASTEVRPHGPWLVIEVQDEGVGISARTAEKIFQPFFTTKATGTGLGLAVVKRIVDAHLGEVSARQNDGLGATFVMKLPGSEVRENVLTPPRPFPATPRPK